MIAVLVRSDVVEGKSSLFEAALIWSGDDISRVLSRRNASALCTAAWISLQELGVVD